MTRQSQDGGAPAPEKVALQLQRIPDTEPLAVVFLLGLKGLRSHFKRTGSSACWSPGKLCSLCERSAPQFRAYAPVEAWDVHSKLWVPCVLEVTGQLEERLRGRDLRGEEWLLWKDQGQSKRVTYGCKHLQRLPAGEVSQAFAIEPTLKKVYRCLELPPYCSNPHGPTVYVEKRAGEAPVIPQSVMPPEEEDYSISPERWA
jgi:hypothetical protein